MAALRLAAIAVAALALAAAHPAATPADAEAFVRRLYAPYVAGPDAVAPIDDPGVFAPTLLALIHRDIELAGGEDPTLDGDPICYCQEYRRLRRVKIRVRATGPHRAFAAVEFDNGGIPSRQTYVLIDTDAGWRIDDIVTPQDGSLAALLRAGIAKRTRLAAP